MEWKEKGLEAIYLGAIAFVGSIFLKKSKPVWKELKRMSTITERMDLLTRKVAILESAKLAEYDTSPIPTFIVNTDGELTYANPALGDLLGFSTLDDVHSKGWMRAVPDDNIETVEKITKRLVEHPSSYECNLKLWHIKTKEFIYTKLRIELVTDDKNEIVETIGKLQILNKPQ